MGLTNMKFIHKSSTITFDKANYTSNLSLESPYVLSNYQHLNLPVKSALKTSSHEKLTSYIVEKVMTSKDVTKLFTEIPAEHFPPINTQWKHNLSRNSSQRSRQNISKLQPNYRRNQIEKLGLHAIQSNQQTTCFSGVIYLPECSVVIAHYLTLYRLRLDSLCEREFRNWCLTVGHSKTACKYTEFLRVYREMKFAHFKESYIINKILSKQNVHLRISDIFGDGERLLRALIIVGKRQHTVQSVIEFYCFETHGKVPFIIRSIEDYNYLLQLANKSIIQPTRSITGDDISYKLSSEISRTKVSLASSRLPLNLDDSHIESFNSANNLNSTNVLKSDKGDFFKNCNSNCDLLYEPFSNYLRNQRLSSNDQYENKNSTIVHKGVDYNLISVIADKSYAYILSKNSKFNSKPFSDKELKFIKSDEMVQSDANQSNTHNRCETLKRILKTEILETFTQRFYGIPLNQIPCGQLYVVQCTIEGRISERESPVNKILVRHSVCGKIMNKEYKLEVFGRGDINFIMHLHGNERHIRKCSEELKREGLARHFKLIHPQYGKIFEEKIQNQEIVK